jgi:predicted secreted hydrolase
VAISFKRIGSILSLCLIGLGAMWASRSETASPNPDPTPDAGHQTPLPENFLPGFLIPNTRYLTPDFKRAVPGYDWNFPRDTGSHPGYRTEWWYYTGHLDGPKGERFGYELTFFRTGLEYPPANRASKWAADDLYFAHFAVTDISGRRFDYDERAARGVLGLAGAETDGQNVWLEKWSARIVDGEHRLSAEGKGWKLDLTAIPMKPPALHGQNGYSQKGAGFGHASNYYSYTRMRTTGTLKRNGQAIPVTGESWMDHEFSTDSLAPNQVGWDWFSLQLDNGEDVMLYRMRRTDGSSDPHSGGTWVGPRGETTALTLRDYQIESRETWTSPHTKITYPARWTVNIPARGLKIEVVPVMADQELETSRSTGVTYWEGAVEVNGTLKGQPIKGRGYVELSGYGGSLAGRA